MRFNSGGFRADGTYSHAELIIRQAQPIPDSFKTGDKPGYRWMSVPSVEDSVWEEFISDVRNSPKFSHVVLPGKTGDVYITAASDHKVLGSEFDDINSGKKILYLLAMSWWTDPAGHHERRSCNFFHFPIALVNIKPVLEACSQYNDFLAKAID